MLQEQTPILPDETAIRRDLTYMTARWSELPEKAKFEVRAFKENAHPQTAKFSPDDVDEAVEWVESMNNLGFNTYAVRNPIRATVAGSAKDDDIIASFFLWADCDEPQAAGNVHRFDGPKWSAAVVTGATPSTRVHTYWALQEPCTDMSAWRDIQATIAAHFGSDPSVINPSRIMRIGGTVAYPAKHKQERGYIKELTTIRTDYDEPRPRVTFDQMRHVFGEATPALKIATDTLPAPLDRERTAIQAMSGVEWNNAILRLVGSYVRKGLSDAEIHALTDPLTIAGYTVEDTRTEVQDIINRTRQNPKFDLEEPQPVAPTPQAVDEFSIDDSASFLSDLEPLEYLIDGLLPRGAAYSLTGHAGHGKTTLALQIALSVARGEMFDDRTTSKGRVLILAGENPYNVKWQYAAALAARKIRAEDADVHFVQGRFSINEWSEVLKSKMEAMPDLKLVIVDSLQAFFEGDNDNDNSQMVDMAHKLRNLCETKQRPAILIIAHPAGKTPSKDNLVPRGGSAFLNEIDGNLTVWSQDKTQQTLHHSAKFRGAGFDPIEWVMQVHEFEHLTDIHGTPLKLPVSRPEAAIERLNREVKSDKLLTMYLETVADDQAVSVREGAERFSVTRWRMEKVISDAKDEKLIRRHAKKYVLTEGGRDFLEAKNAGL